MIYYQFMQTFDEGSIHIPDQEGRLVNKNQYYGQTIGVFTSGGDAQGIL